MKVIVNPENKKKKRYTFPPVGEDGKFTTPFKISYFDENGEIQTFETQTPMIAQIIVKTKEDPLFLDYIIALMVYPGFLDHEIKNLFRFIREKNLKLL